MADTLPQNLGGWEDSIQVFNKVLGRSLCSLRTGVPGERSVTNKNELCLLGRSLFVTAHTCLSLVSAHDPCPHTLLLLLCGHQFQCVLVLEEQRLVLTEQPPLGIRA